MLRLSWRPRQRSLSRAKAESELPINIPRGASDEAIEHIVAVMREYEADHPKPQIDVDRQSRFSIRIRIIDAEFARKGKPDRSDHVWRYLERAPEDVQSDISTVLLLTPDETSTSFANMELEDPVPAIP
jgi:hypothetical protein